MACSSVNLSHVRLIRRAAAHLVVAALALVVCACVTCATAYADQPKVAFTVGQKAAKSDAAVLGGAKASAGKASGSTTSISAKLSGISGGVKYRLHKDGGSWSAWKSDGSKAGVSGKADSVAFALTGAAAEWCDLYYRAWSREVGWLDWTCSDSGTSAISLTRHIGTVQMVLVYKGSGCPCAYKAGWRVSGSKLRYRNADGTYKKSATYKGITFNSNGVAKSTTAAKLKIKCLKILARITTAKASKSKRLAAIWKYCTNRSRFYYLSTYPNLSQAGWQRKAALKMLSTKRGNCYSFACIFAALAYEAGYDGTATPYVVCGRVSGSRDGAGDGMTRHAWVVIKGKNYDPEGVFANWLSTGLAYGCSSYQVSHSIQKRVKFTSNATVGSSVYKKLSSSKARWGLHKVNGKYYYFSGTKTLKSSWLTIKGYRYHFGPDGAAAVGPKRIGKRRYVFTAKARLSTGKHIHLVKVKGKTYRVSANGRAKKGWNSKKTKYYNKTGLLMTGTRVLGGKLFVFTKKGTYCPVLTSRARAVEGVLLKKYASVEPGCNLSVLIETLGAPKSKLYQDSCNALTSQSNERLTGKDGIWRYAHIVVCTFKASNGAEYLVGIGPR